MAQAENEPYELVDDGEGGWGFDQNPEEWDTEVMIQYIARLDDEGDFLDDYEDYFNIQSITGQNFKRQQLGNGKWCRENLNMKLQISEAFAAIVRKRIVKYENREGAKQNNNHFYPQPYDPLDFIPINNHMDQQNNQFGFPTKEQNKIKSNESEQKQMDQLKKENLKLMNELNKIKKTNARNLDDISNQNDILKVKNVSLNEMIQRLKAELTDIKQLNQPQTQRIVKQSQNEIQTLRNQRQSQEKQAMELKRENLKVKNEMNEIKESNKLQKQKIAKQQNEIQTLQNQYESAENEMNELRNSTNSKQENISNLEEQILRLENEKNELKRINKTQSDELNKLMDDEKEYQLQIKDLMEENKKLKMKAIDPSRYSEWSTDDILLWILSLENGRYSKYEKALRANLKEEGVNGDDLDAVDSSDVKDWGVTSFKDKKGLHQSIKQLTSQNQQKSKQYNNNNDNEGTKVAPTAYI